MARKVLFNECALTDLKASDTEGLGVLYEDKYGRVYRFVKNVGSTALVAAGCCVKKLGQSSALDTTKYVLSSDAATGPSTCLVTMPAGVPVTAIAASGAATGDHGWIQVKGPAKVSMLPLSTAVNQEAGCCAISTTTAGGNWGAAVTSLISSTAGGIVNLRCVQLSEPLTEVTPATAASAYVQVRCLD